jgi:hypothetical protein
MHIGTMIKAGEDLKKLKKKSEGKHRYPTVRTEETCEEQLRRMCKEIAEDITDGKEDVHKWMEDVYDIEWITFQDGTFKGARLLVAGGGPTVWVNVKNDEVEGYWAGDHIRFPFQDNIGLRAYLEELHAGSK